jgi:hypothetical protein
MDWLLGTFVISVPGFLSEVFFRTLQDEKRQYVLRMVSASAGVILPASLIYFGGAYGVVIGRFLGGLVLSCVGIILVYRQYKITSQGSAMSTTTR